MSTSGKYDQESKEREEIYKEGLDDLVNVNSLFTVAVFVGLSFAKPGQHSLDGRPECDADTSQAKRLVTWEVISFSCFLFSSLVAKSLKVNLQLAPKEVTFDKQNRLKKRKWIMLCLSVVASFLGCVFLILSMAFVIQIRLGKLSCKSPYAEGAVFAMCVIFLVAMVFYMPVVWEALRKTLQGSPSVDGDQVPGGSTGDNTSGSPTSDQMTRAPEEPIDRKTYNGAVDYLVNVKKLFTFLSCACFRTRAPEEPIDRKTYTGAVDDLVNVNKLFTLAVFLGLSFSTESQQSLENREECLAGLAEARRIVLFEVVSFSCFLSSTLMAKTLRLHLNIYRKKKGDEPEKLLRIVVRGVIVTLSALTSFFGYVFLLLSMVDIIQFQLGRLPCRGVGSLIPALALGVIGCAALVIFLCMMFPALLRPIANIVDRSPEESR